MPLIPMAPGRAWRPIAFALALLVSIGGGGPAWAKLSPQDKADIARVEGYLNGIHTLKGRFVQIAPDGSLAGGKVYLRRPGRLRFAYDPPSPLLIVADRFWLILYDSQLKQTNRLPLSSTPVSVLVAGNVKFGGRTIVEKVSRQPGSLRITVRDSDHPAQGSITLVFSDKPLVLRSWVVTDAQGLKTAIALNGVETNIPLDPKLFVFLDPVDNYNTR